MSGGELLRESATAANRTISAVSAAATAARTRFNRSSRSIRSASAAGRLSATKAASSAQQVVQPRHHRIVDEASTGSTTRSTDIPETLRRAH